GSVRREDVQGRPAGRGVVHSEMPAAELAAGGGPMKGFELWVNLPRGDKMSEPRYQEIPASRIPEAQSPDGLAQVRVIAGESMGRRAVIQTRTPISYLHFRLKPGASIVQSA